MNTRQAGASAEIDITPSMAEVGRNRLWELLEAGTGSTYVVSEVYLAMELDRLKKGESSERRAD
jgi:hypothetical protein